MKRHIAGLAHHSSSDSDLLEGIFLVRVDRAYYRWHSVRPFFVLRFVVLEPHAMANRSFTGRLYCSDRALWKLNWFLRDFGYDADLLGREEVDDRGIVGLQGIVRVSNTNLNGRSFLNLDGFASAADWNEFSPPASQEAARDL